ncbi:MAG: hypothetical protein EZS28_033443 [Streblomastix strix]|uniref:Uncharacterized protein n=1 Tax=Streblomastix strix TaxID=222440 RepID=A0A5J4UKJ9_9EUKA|nr:MAG: hypothetical protein EZS28_033443 [Streblomastix strix]
MPNQGTKHGKPKKFFTTWKDSSIPHGPEMENGRMFLIQILVRIGPSRGAQQLLINGQRFETQSLYLYEMGTFAEFSYEHNINIDQLLFISQEFLLLEVINWFIRWNPSASSANTHQYGLNTMLFLILDIPQIALTPSKLAYRAVLNCKIINRRYSNM